MHSLSNGVDVGLLSLTEVTGYIQTTVKWSECPWCKPPLLIEAVVDDEF